MARKTVKIFDNMDFGIDRVADENPNVINFKLHNHDDLYEIVLILNGDCEFYVEGNAYRLEPRDFVFTRPFEMHRMICLTEKTYERVILYIKSDYFKKHGCERFLDIFNNRSLGTGNCISRDIADTDLRECIGRILKYCENGEYEVADKAVFEFLYLLNSCKMIYDNFYVKNERVRDIIMYINRNLSDNLSLDAIAKEFFIAKNYMCRIFKQYTGHTLNQYISKKRILLVQELHKNGQTLLDASFNAGFNSYANFYKCYVKQTGETPRAMDNEQRAVIT